MNLKYLLLVTCVFNLFSCDAKHSVSLTLHAFESDLAFTTIEVYKVDTEAEVFESVFSDPVFTGQANEKGRLTLNESLEAGVYVVKASGGQYVDYASHETISLNIDEYLLSHFIVDRSMQTSEPLSISPYTAIATTRALGELIRHNSQYADAYGYLPLEDIFLPAENHMQQALGFNPYRTDSAEIISSTADIELTESEMYRLLMEARSLLTYEWTTDQIYTEGAANDHFDYSAIGLTLAQMKDVQDGSYLDGYVQLEDGTSNSTYIRYGKMKLSNAVNGLLVPQCLIDLSNRHYQSNELIFDFAYNIHKGASSLAPNTPNSYELDSEAPKVHASFELPLTIKYVDSLHFYVTDTTSFSDISVRLISGGTSTEKSYLLENNYVTVTISNSELFEYESKLEIDIQDYWGNMTSLEYDIYSELLAP